MTTIWKGLDLALCLDPNSTKQLIHNACSSVKTVCVQNVYVLMATRNRNRNWFKRKIDLRSKQVEQTDCLTAHKKSMDANSTRTRINIPPWLLHHFPPEAKWHLETVCLPLMNAWHSISATLSPCGELTGLKGLTPRLVRTCLTVSPLNLYWHTMNGTIKSVCTTKAPRPDFSAVLVVFLRDTLCTFTMPVPGPKYESIWWETNYSVLCIHAIHPL